MAGKKTAKNGENQKKDRLERELDQWIADFYRKHEEVERYRRSGTEDFP